MFIVTRETERKLVDTVGGINNEASSWRAVYFKFDQLLEQYRNEYQKQIAINLLGDLLVAHQGGIYVFPDNTIILLCRNITKGQLDKAIFQLRYLFMDDPLAYDAGGDENPEFCSVFDLGVQYAEFYQLCRKKLSQNIRVEQNSGGGPRAAQGETPPQNVARSFTPSRLAHVEHDLNKADLSRVFRRQPVCAVTADYDVRRIFDEYYIHISHLRQMLRTEADFLGNRTLFRYLTQLLDDRMLDMLIAAPARNFETPVSLNFNIETILSRKFRDFDAIIKPVLKVSLVIEIQIGDIFSDIAAYITARNLLQKMGYKVCIDGLTTLGITLIERDRLGFDLAKLQWNAEIDADVGAEENYTVMRAVKSCGPNRVILCRCDTRQAISYGQALGINLFQGRFLDRILNPNQKVEN
jgi:EAL domain-containing protein (putative c-di-GMP-specific phosphodiesterase class I)